MKFYVCRLIFVENVIIRLCIFYFDTNTSEIECSVISKLVHLQMPAKVRSDEDARSEEEEVEDDFSTAGGWAQGLAKGVFAHKKSSVGKRKLKSPKKQSRYESGQITPVCNAMFCCTRKVYFLEES